MPLRVALCQPLIPQYRVPVYARLAASPGIDLTVWASRGARGSLKSAPTEGLFEVVESEVRWFGPLLWQPNSLACMRTTPPPDVVMLNWNSRALEMPIAVRRARRRGIGTVLWSHGFGTKAPLVGDWVRRSFARSADAFMLYGPTGREKLRREGFPPEKLFMAVNALDQSPIQAAVADWSADPTRLEAFRAEHGLGDDPVMLYIARLEPEKRPDLAVDALARVAERVPARLVLIGDGSVRGDLEAQAKRLGVPERVHFAGALYDDRDIAPWALNSKVLVHPGAIGLSIFHAFGYRLPVVTSDRVEIQMPEFETHVDGENGLLYRHGDAEHLADRLLAILEDEPRRLKMAEAAFEVVSGPTGRNIEGMVGGILEAIDHAAAQHGKSRR
ncbi:MAG: glycosyltransferase [Planctomycetota bacterium]|nr:glycosyltransferase [Planctomycetota bacterium]